MVWRLSAVVAVSTIALVYFGLEIDLRKIFALLADVKLPWVMLALGAFLLGHVLRCLRYKLIWKWQLNGHTLGITAAHGFTTYMFPLRLGELVLPFLLRRSRHASFRQGLAGLVMVRVFDAILIGVLGATLFLVSPEALASLLPTGLSWVTHMLEVFLILSLLVCVLSLSLVPGLVSATDKGQFLLVSAGIWAAVLGMNYFTILAIGLQPDVEVLVLIIVLGLFATVLPLQGVAGLGGHELVWVTSLVAGGISTSLALELAIASHVLMVGYACVLGGLGLGLMSFFKGQAGQN